MMKVFAPIINKQDPIMAYTSLKECCEALGVSYSSAINGKRQWIEGDGTIKIILEIHIIKQKRK